jgi:phage baseplate assembly protein W
MAIKKQTFGIDFPFVNSNSGDYVGLTTIPESEVKAMLIHLLLTKKGSRYFLPDFGTNLYQYIFEPLDDITLGKIETEIQDAVEKYIPNLKLNDVIIIRVGDEEQYKNDTEREHQIRINLDYTITTKTFQTSDKLSITI